MFIRTKLSKYIKILNMAQTIRIYHVNTGLEFLKIAKTIRIAHVNTIFCIDYLYPLEKYLRSSLSKR